MKKLFIIGLMLVTFITSVMAGSITESYPCGWHGRTCEVTKEYDSIDADTIDGYTAEDLMYDDTRVLRKINKNTRSISENTEDIEYFQSKEAAYLSDSKGTTMTSVKKFLFGEFYDTFLRKVFVLRTEYDALNDRLVYLESKLESKELGISIDDFQKQKAKELGSYGKYTYQYIDGVDYYYLN